MDTDQRPIVICAPDETPMTEIYPLRDVDALDTDTIWADVTHQVRA